MAAGPVAQNQSYTFSTEPRAVPRRKYRDPMGPPQGGDLASNLMWDRRVVRGNTYATHVLPATAQVDALEMQKEEEARKRKEWKRRQKLAAMKAPKTPEPVDGRKHIDVQTESYLEELTDKLVEVDIETQTDAFMDRPASPLFVPIKTGVDNETQIYDGELFDFDYEVEPILEVLVGKTLEQSIIEVMEEEELANMRAHQEQFIQMRAAEIAEAQRMEEAERRRFEEKERRANQERERLQSEQKLSEKIAARSHARSYVSDVLASTFASLQDEGFFYDPLTREINEIFVPWLMGGMTSQLQQERTARQLLDATITGSLNAQGKVASEAVSAQLKVEEQIQAVLLEADTQAQAKLDEQAKIDSDIAEARAKRRAEKAEKLRLAEEEARRLQEEEEEAAKAAAAEAEGAAAE